MSGLPAGRSAIALPQRMRTLPRDARGYPIPFLVMLDKSGRPQFTINDVRKHIQCVRKRLCAICGKRFDAADGLMDLWFVGGSRCFLHEYGAFLDPPMHQDCARYALQVCPFLAAPRYARRIDTAKLKADDLPHGIALVAVDHMQPQLPERFGLGLCHNYQMQSSVRNPNGVFLVDDWRYIEWWKAGECVNAPDSGKSPPLL